MCNRRWGLLLAAVAPLALTGPARALINPKFTPVHLVSQSDVILQVAFAGLVKDGKVSATVTKALKGRWDAKGVDFDMTSPTSPASGTAAAALVKEAQDSPAVLFIGQLPAKPSDQHGIEDGAATDAARRGYLHVGGKWLILVEDDAGLWGLDEESTGMLATWNGGSDMLLRAVGYILQDAAAEVPVKAGTTWAGVLTAGKVAGTVAGAEAVDLAGKGTLELFVAGDGGDRLFACDGKTLRDATASRKLTTRSTAWAWADFNADGRVDLASWDGKALTLALQQADGTFAAAPVENAPADCTALAACDGPTPGKAALIVATAAGPRWLMPGQAAQPLAEAPAATSATTCLLLADVDGDGLCDLLEVAAGASRLYRGKGPGQFAAPVPCTVASGAAPARARVGDFDGDGALDILTAAAGGVRLWQNLGQGRFVETLKLSGELGYNAKAGASDAAVGDLNNDGRQDVALLYGGIAPQVFFNRGFRSFGISQSLDIEKSLPSLPAARGQQAGCLADLTDDGAQDLAMVLADGTVALLVRTPFGDDLAVRAVVPPAAGFSGPVTVRASVEGRSLGAWQSRLGGPGAFIGRPEAGPVRLTWQFAGRAAQTQEVTVESKPVTVVLAPPAAEP